MGAKKKAPKKKRSSNNPDLGRVVLVRDNRAGIHVGTLVSFEAASKTAVLKDARKVWYWSGAASCHGIAARGLDHGKSKVCPKVERVTSCDVIEIIPCSKEGAASVADAPEWKP